MGTQALRGWVRRGSLVLGTVDLRVLTVHGKPLAYTYMGYFQWILRYFGVLSGATWLSRDSHRATEVSKY